MPVKIHRPTSPARRQTSVLVRPKMTSKASLKASVFGLRKQGGRNSTGQITVRHQGGGAKRLYRTVDFKREKFDIPATVTAIEYDPNRSADLAVVTYRDGEKRYMILPQDLAVGASVMSSQAKIPPEIGNCMPLEHMPVGTTIHGIEIRPGSGGILVRSAGVGAQLMAVEGDYAQLKMPSGEVRLVLKTCLATIGSLGNVDHRHVRWGKAGRMRHRGIRPSVRGKAMNPVDHPHGGGEGSNPIGMKHPKTPWGKPALGHTTRKKHRPGGQLIIRRRPNKNKQS